ncbi:MAG: hypothetical protein ABW173_11265, partial [Sphingomonas sp.]
MAAPLSERPSIVVISDWVEGWPPAPADPAAADARWAALPASDHPWTATGGGLPDVRGGYLERLPLALIAAGVAERAEIWHHWRAGGPPPLHRESPFLARRAFRL